jgi:hypothetical protein
MAEYSGRNAIGTWVTASGTTTLTGNQRTITYTPTVDLFDATAGADVNKTYVVGQKDGQLAISMLGQTTGSATLAQFVEGMIGTISNLATEGTAVGSPTKTFPAICLGVTETAPYSDVTTWDISWQQNGARTDGTIS